MKLVEGSVWMQPIASIITSWTSCDASFEAGDVSGWKLLLDRKRRESSYDYCVEVLRRDGWARPLMLALNYSYNYGDRGAWVHGNGHHRLAAAIDLGMTRIPYRLVEFSGSHGEWMSYSSEDMPKVPGFDRVLHNQGCYDPCPRLEALNIRKPVDTLSLVG